MLHNHRAEVSDAIRRKVELMVARAALRFRGAMKAVVRFEEDGRVRRVEVVLHLSRREPVVALGEGRFFGPASAQALARLGEQLRHGKSRRKARTRRPAPRKRGE
ncbi:MAG: HPF/RaiA family ribosome-associated protein [Gemmatimonadales bacterium]